MEYRDTTTLSHYVLNNTCHCFVAIWRFIAILSVSLDLNYGNLDQNYWCKIITIDYDFLVHLYTQRLFKSELSFGKGRVILPTKTTLCNFWSMLYKLIYCCLLVSLLSHFWLIHFFHLHLLYQPYLGLCQAQCVQSHQRQPMSAVAITACEVQVSAANSQTVPTVAAGV